MGKEEIRLLQELKSEQSKMYTQLSVIEEHVKATNGKVAENIAAINDMKPKVWMNNVWNKIQSGLLAICTFVIGKLWTGG